MRSTFSLLLAIMAVTGWGASSTLGATIIDDHFTGNPLATWVVESDAGATFATPSVTQSGSLLTIGGTTTGAETNIATKLRQTINRVDMTSLASVTQKLTFGGVMSSGSGSVAPLLQIALTGTTGSGTSYWASGGTALFYNRVTQNTNGSTKFQVFTRTLAGSTTLSSAVTLSSFVVNAGDILTTTYTPTDFTMTLFDASANTTTNIFTNAAHTQVDFNTTNFPSTGGAMNVLDFQAGGVGTGVTGSAIIDRFEVTTTLLVPEPTTMGLVLIGLGGLMTLRR